MTELLQKAFDEVSKLPTEEQDAVAAWILEEIADEHLWDEAFANSADKLARMADKAMAEHRAGRTQPLDPDAL